MRRLTRLVLLFSALSLMAATIQAQFFSSDSITIKFAPTEKLDGVTWAPSVSLTDSGLYLGRVSPDSSAEIWVQTQPISAGMSWRPPSSIMVRVDVESGAEDFTYLRSYIRYSCDKAHWSTWYNLSPAKTKTAGMAFTYESWISLPRIAHKAYSDLAQEWWMTDPAWSSDEHELCVWIAKSYPEFFSSEFPFIGYIQVRIEGESRGLRLKSLRVSANSAVSGVTSVKKRQVRSTIDGKWFFDLSKTNK
jgi:hypothetical protein